MPGTNTTSSAGGTATRRPADALLFSAARRGGPWLPVLILTALVLAASSLALPAVIGRAADAALGHASTSWITWLAALIAVMVACDAAEDLAAGATTARSTAWLRHLVSRHLLAVGPPAVDRFGPGDIASRLTGNAADAGRAAPDAVRAVANALPSVGAIVALGLIDPWLCLTFLCGVPVLAALGRIFARTAFDVAEQYLAAQAGIANSLVDALSGSRTIAAAATVERETDRVLAGLPDLHRHGISMWRTQIRMSAQDAVIVSLLEVAVLAVAGVELARGRITPGDFLAAGQYVLLASTLGHATSTLGRMAVDRAASKRLAETLEMEPRGYGTRSLAKGRGRLELRGVTVRARGRAVLDRVDLDIPAGSLIAIVGASGSGKSVLGALAGRLLDPDEGDVLLDGVPLSALEHRHLRRAVSYGFERPALVGQTVSDAISLGVYRPTGGVLRAAARAARADGFIRRLPGGYATPLSDCPMSGGERQRVGLARAFAHAGRLLVLDDVASSLDTVTEHEISETLTTEFSDRTRLIIAHRVSTAARADLVVWLEAGRVRAVASHLELWFDDAYRALFGAESGSQPEADGGADRGSSWATIADRA